jgi:hypothetical protein
MAKKAKDPRLDLLLVFYDQAFDGRAWHGPTLRGSVRGVTYKEALWRPTPKHHNIWELVLHAAYWKYAVKRRITHGKKGMFKMEGSNWFNLPATPNAAAWKNHVAMLDAYHRELRVEIAKLDLERFRRLDLIYGIASHDLYHAGQIQLLKRLLRGGTAITAE